MQWKAFFLSVILLGGFVVMMFFLPSILTLFAPKIQIDFKPQQTKVYEITGENKQMDIIATVLPKFKVKLSESEFSNFWKADASERKKILESSVLNRKGATLQLTASYDEEKKDVTLIPKRTNDLKPGLYMLNIKIKTVQGEYKKFTQDFTWGVIALNTNKGIYQKGEDVKIGMSVLDDLGSTKCIASGDVNFNTAKIWITVISPSGRQQYFSTDNKSIYGSSECADKSITNNPDFFTHIQAEEIGKYKIQMVAENINGKRGVDDTFIVQSSETPYVIERIEYPTRIYPRIDYPVKISIKVNKSYKGVVTDILPASFKIRHISQNGDTLTQGDFQVVRWNVNWRAGETHDLEYTIKFPMIAPEFYIVGPLHIGDYDEGRSWQIASDAIFTFVQEKHNTTVTTGNSVSVTLNSTPVPNNLVILICSRTSSNSFTTPGSWTSAYNNSSGPRQYMYYRVAPVGMSSTVTCTAGTSGVLGIQVLEFSGNATTSVRDQRSRRNSINCSGGSMTSATIKPGNPDVLVISATSSTTARTVTNHSNSFVDSATSFNGTSGTFDSAWQEVLAAPSTNEVITYSGNAGTCDNLIVSFNSTISITQGSFRFYDNQDNSTPSADLGVKNANLTIPSPNYPFRLRQLLLVDSGTGNTLAIGTGDFILQVAELPTSNDCLDGSYTPVATNSAIAYNPNPSLDNLIPISSMAAGLDPTDTGYGNKNQNYMELYTDDNPDNDISNNQATVANNQAGLWDFSLIENSPTAGTHTYCLLITDNAGNLLDAYNHIPRVTTNQVDVLIRGGTTIKGGNSGGQTLIR